MDNQIRRLPPQDLEAEQAVLGGVFLAPRTLADAQEFLVEDDFYKRAHQLVFHAMSDLSLQDQAIDVLTVRAYLEDHKQLDDIGGVPYLADLAEAVPTAANVVYYAKIVAEKAQLRRLISTSEQIIQQSYDDQANVPDLMENAESMIMAVSDGNNHSGFKHIKDVLNDAMA